MNSARIKALDGVLNRVVNKETNEPIKQISEYYAENVFGSEVMKKYLHKDAFKAVQDAVNNGKAISRKAADLIAEGMKNWAIDKGATHYTHWFQPLRGSTAEKHDSFFEPTTSEKGVEKFSGKALIQQEPDASSFPNGGIRNTFEARGYTAWDPSSPAFIIAKSWGKTLCIPTIFVSYTGEALDYKAPLIKATHVLQKAATEVCRYFDPKVNNIHVSLGVEQEYFLVDLALYHSRPDLMLSGRTLIGHIPAKGQQLEDHYFGSIPDRVYAYMTDFEQEAHKLGIPLKTRHNEVAPAQFECAPMYEEMNLAIDHNSLLMDIMESVAQRHGFKVLLHEKPFKGINGSGKHNNWSLITDTGVNLLAPGQSPQDNLQFLTFFINTIKAVYEHADLLRASIASPGNDHRLGANEAPPAIISVFIGSLLSDVLNEFETAKSNKKAGRVSEKTLNIHRIPEILLDNTDRNRTSPFAFTGNKFEFRAVGSSDHCASSMVALNTIVANQLKEFKQEVDALIKKGKKQQDAIESVLRSYIKSSKKIIFEGNGYSEEWVKEAKKRGLNNITTTPHALDSYLTPKSLDLFIKHGIFSHKELEARTDIRYDHYTLKIQIEGRVLGDMIQTYVIPAAIEYQRRLADTIRGLKEAGESKSSYAVHLSILKELSKQLNALYSDTQKMTEERKRANKIENAADKAKAYCEKVKPYFETIRYASDKIEQLLDDEMWRLPKYRELLFLR